MYRFCVSTLAGRESALSTIDIALRAAPNGVNGARITTKVASSFSILA